MVTDIGETRICSKCGEQKHILEYGVRADTGRLDRRCRDCVAAYHRKWRKKNPGRSSAATRRWQLRNPEKVRDGHRRRSYGMEPGEFDARLEAQNRECAVCQKLIDESADVDHCHKTGKVRALLCRQCNRGLGQMRDDARYLQLALAYLHRFGEELVHPWAEIGGPPEHRDFFADPTMPILEPEIGSDVRIQAFVTVDCGIERATRVGSRTILLTKVHIGHDAHVGSDCELAPGVVICGHATIGNNVKVGVNASILPHRKVGDGARIGAGAVVTKDVPAGETWVGNPARPLVKDIDVSYQLGEKKLPHPDAVPRFSQSVFNSEKGQQRIT
jgi:acetyltransferase-like isoleucine patch superfamily enzyme